MSSTLNSINQAQVNQVSTFPIEVKKVITFKVNSQEDLDYLNSTEQEADFIADMKFACSDIALDIVDIDGVKIE